MAEDTDPESSINGPEWSPRVDGLQFFKWTLVVVGAVLIVIALLFFVGALVSDLINEREIGTWWATGQNNGAAVLSALVAGAFTVLIGVAGAYFAAMSATQHAVSQQGIQNINLEKMRVKDEIDLETRRVQTQISMECNRLDVDVRIALAVETRLSAARIANQFQEFRTSDLMGNPLAFQPGAFLAIVTELRTLSGLWRQASDDAGEVDVARIDSPPSDAAALARWVIIWSASAFVKAAEEIHRLLNVKLDPSTCDVEKLVTNWASANVNTLDGRGKEEDQRPTLEEAKMFFMDSVFLDRYQPDDGKVPWKEVDTLPRRYEVAAFLRAEPTIFLTPRDRRDWLLELAQGMPGWLAALAVWQQQVATSFLTRTIDLPFEVTSQPRVAHAPESVLGSWRDKLLGPASTHPDFSALWFDGDVTSGHA